MTLSTDNIKRQGVKLWDALFNYFPRAWLAVVDVSIQGHKQHNLDKDGSGKLFWQRDVSTDHLNKAMRHLFDHGMGTPFDTDGTRHLAKAIWRLSAQLENEIREYEIDKRVEDDAGVRASRPVLNYMGQDYNPKPLSLAARWSLAGESLPDL